MYLFVCFIYMLYVTYVTYVIYIYIQLYAYYPIFHRGKYVKRVGFINHVPPWFEDLSSRSAQPNARGSRGSQELQMGNSHSHSHVIPQLYMKNVSLKFWLMFAAYDALIPHSQGPHSLHPLKSQKKHGWNPVAINFQGFPSCVCCFLQLSSHMLSKARAKPNPPSLKRCTNTERPRESSKSFAWILGWWALWAPHKG